MIKRINGTIHGNTIRLDSDPGLQEGQQVQVTVESPSPEPSGTAPSDSEWGEGLQRCAGSLSEQWDGEDDTILEQLRDSRSRDSRAEIDE